MGALAWLAAARLEGAETANESRSVTPAGDTGHVAKSEPAGSTDELAKIVADRDREPTVRCIGPVTTVTEVSTGVPFSARVDTGATTCSIHYEALEIEHASASPQENVGKRVRFLIENPAGEKEWISAKIVDRVKVRTSTDADERYKVLLKLRWQDVEKKVQVTLSDREKMKYPLLLGRNFLRGDFLVDVNLKDEN
jgi:hypothetical protein